MLLALIASATARADQVHVAVASNFTGPMQRIAARFEHETGHKVVASYGATGAFYAQIRNGAPFELLLAADESVPLKLEQEGRAVPGSRFTYAIGKLVLWSAAKQVVDDQGEVLKHHRFDRLAIANPSTAPYGMAALQTMKSMGLYEAIAPRLVQGENITQAFQFVSTGNAPLGFVAMSQVYEAGRLKSGSAWIVPAGAYRPIRQDAVVLPKGRGRPVVAAFVTYLQSERTRSLIRSYGYDL